MMSAAERIKKKNIFDNLAHSREPINRISILPSHLFIAITLIKISVKLYYTKELKY